MIIDPPAGEQLRASALEESIMEHNMILEKQGRTGKYLFDNKWFSLFREKPGVISPPEDGPIWIIFYDCYMQTDHSLLGLLWQLITEHHSDHHLVG